MNEIISFPGLGLEFTLDRVAFTVFGMPIYWYGILIALGVVLALWFCMTQKEKYGITEDDLLDAVLWGVPLSVVGARVYYIIFYLDLFKKSDGSFDWGSAVAIWDGGLAIYGAVIAAILVGVVLCKKRGLKLGALTDLVVMGFLIGQTVGRWGNFVNQEAFGSNTTLPWGMYSEGTEAYLKSVQVTLPAGVTVDPAAPVHPTFLYESIWCLVGFAVLASLYKKRRFNGQIFLGYIIWYGLGRYWIEGLRTDSLYLFDWTIAGQPIRVSQVLSLVLMIAALAVLFYNIRLHPHKPEELYVNIVAAREAAQAEEPAEAPEVAEPAEAPEAAEPAEAPEAPEVPEESSEE